MYSLEQYRSHRTLISIDHINTGLLPKCLNTSGLLSLWLTTAKTFHILGHFQQTLCKYLNSSFSQRKGKMMHHAVTSNRNNGCLAWLIKAYFRYLLQQQKHKPLPNSYLLNTVAQRNSQRKVLMTQGLSLKFKVADWTNWGLTQMKKWRIKITWFHKTWYQVLF